MSLCVEWRESMAICLLPEFKLGMVSAATLFRNLIGNDYKGINALKDT